MIIIPVLKMNKIALDHSKRQKSVPLYILLYDSPVLSGIGGTVITIIIVVNLIRLFIADNCNLKT